MLNRAPDAENSKKTDSDSVVVFFIGREGSGKTTLGKEFATIARDYKPYFYDGDDAIEPGSVMDYQVKHGLAVLPSTAKSYINDRLIPAVVDLASKHKVLIVSQALFSNESRESLVKKLPKSKCIFVNIDVTREQQLENIKTRDAIFWRPTTALSWFFFEKPAATLTSYTIKNPGKGHDIQPILESLLERIKPYLPAIKLFSAEQRSVDIKLKQPLSFLSKQQRKQDAKEQHHHHLKHYPAGLRRQN